MIQSRWKPVIPHLQEFQRHLSGRVPELTIVAANDQLWTNEEFENQKKTGDFKGYGVYLIFGPDESLEYVGLAMNQFDDRIWSHEACVNRRWTDVIPFCHEHYFLAPALEFLLITQLQPPKNTVYKGYTILQPTCP